MNNIPENIQSDIADKMSIVVDGQQIEQFWNESLLLTMDNVGGQFSFTTPFFPGTKAYRDLFKPFSYDSVQIYIGGSLALNGYIEMVSPSLTSGQNTVTVQGRSKAAIVVDCTFQKGDTMEWLGSNLSAIASESVLKFRLGVSFTSSPGAIFEKAGPDSPTTIVFDFLKNLARQRSLLMSQTKSGDLLFQKAATGAPVAELVEGQQGLILSNAGYNGTKRFQKYDVYGQEPGKNNNYAGALDTIPILRIKALQANDTNQANIIDSANWALTSDIAASIDIPLSYEGWLKPDGGLWSENKLITIKAPSLMIYKPFKMMIKSVEFKGTPSSKMTNFTITIPEAYSGKPPKEFPWD